MAKYIDADKMADELSKVPWYERDDEKQAIRMVKEFPAADVREVRHGEWVVSRTDFGWNCSEFPTHCKCTLCGREVPYQDRDNYCPNCGAKMDEVEE